MNVNPSETKVQKTPSDTEPGRDIRKEMIQPRSPASGLRVGSLLRVWTEVSKINYLSLKPLDVITSVQSVLRRKSIGLPAKQYSIQNFVPPQLRNKSDEDLFTEQFPVNVTSLMNEGNLWGCFYIFPEIYTDVYSPVVSIRNIEDVPELVGGVLTRDMVTACLSYLKRTPILGDYVYIKLDLTSKNLINVDVLQHYKYLVYVDLSSNFLTTLAVLSYLPYLQFLSVAFNRLSTVLEYDIPQWFLTEVHYKYNSVKKIRDLSAFWSITILDLSHNNIKCISGLENLRYLRRLDLSFNHIQRLENLNHLRLLWLDLSYNNISSFEFGDNAGLWTLLYLEYLNLNENSLTSLKMFSDCTRLRELHVRNNRMSMLLELAVYMRQMRRLIVLDLRANPICSTPGYKDVVINTFPILLSLDANELDPVEQRTVKMDMTPDVHAYATRRLLRLLYIEQLSRALVSPCVLPADNTEVPIVVLVGYEAVGKGSVARRLASQFSSKVQLARQHTTAPHHYPGHYREVSRTKFDDMLLEGQLLTYSEMDGESYGLSREQAFVKDGRVRIVSMDLVGALMLRLRGYQPYLILATCADRLALAQRQQFRKTCRQAAIQQRLSLEMPLERSTLQVLLSERIIITGILNEILLCLPEGKEQSEFVIDSECSLMMDSEVREAVKDYAKGINIRTLLASSTTSLEEVLCKRPVSPRDRHSPTEPSLHSVYKGSQGPDEYSSCINGQNSYQEAGRDHAHKYTTSARKGFAVVPDNSKSSKSVTFTSEDGTETAEQDAMGMLVEPRISDNDKHEKKVRSISTRIQAFPKGHQKPESHISEDDYDLWLAFLTETGQLQASDMAYQTTDTPQVRHDSKVDDPNSIWRQINFYHKILSETYTTHIRDDYEGIHRKCPGLFWDTDKTVERHIFSIVHSLTHSASNFLQSASIQLFDFSLPENVRNASATLSLISNLLLYKMNFYSYIKQVTMDNPDEAFAKLHGIIRDIVNSQKRLKPMFDIDFANLSDYPTVEKRLEAIRKEISPHQLFY